MKCLERCMQLWGEGNLHELVLEGELFNGNSSMWVRRSFGPILC